MIILLALSQFTQCLFILLSYLDGSCAPFTLQRIVNINMLNVVVQRMDYHIKKIPAK